MKKLLYGCAYYDEYMPVERLALDMRMMREAGMNLIRIAESTWASEEPRDGEFDFSHVRRAIEAAKAEGISVLVGTPTYAVPPWLAAKHPEIIAVTEQGPGRYGPRQNMDITNPDFLRHAERVIRKLMEAVQPYDNVIGFQLDNETKHYHTAGPNVRRRFIAWLRDRFGSVGAVNEAFGFAYWSNRVDSWEHMPDPAGTINGSYWAAFEQFRRHLVTDYLLWQRGIVDEYRRPDQFVTHNFDFGWRGSSFGVQPDVDHDQAARAVTVAGCDIYHPSQDELTGKEIAFCGSLCRCLKRDNYLVLETEAQGFPDWTPFPGQLRLQAFSHLAGGSNSVAYWHWHSLHNAIETYWKGVLSHDLRENRIYREAAAVGADFARLSGHLVNLKKESRVALLVSNPSLTALGPSPMFPLPGGKTDYNDIVRQYADALYELNVEYDVIFPDSADLSGYDLLIVPALYSAPESLLCRLKAYAENGGTLLAAVKCGFADEHVKVRADLQPYLLREAFGASYQEFTVPGSAVLRAEEGFPEAAGLAPAESVRVWMELLEPGEARVLARYEHPAWGAYAAVTENAFGQGTAIYAGCLMSDAWTKALVLHALARSGIPVPFADLYPVVVRSGVNEAGKRVVYYLNFSGVSRSVPCVCGGLELLSSGEVSPGTLLSLAPWDVKIIEQA